jgi:uncharacterized membrane protein YbhN (UPF0104 family)
MKSWHRRALTLTFYLVLAVFLVIYLTRVDYSVFATSTFAWWFLTVAGAFALGFRYWQAFIWITVLRGLGAREVRLTADLAFVYAKSWLGRYIPGTAPWILGKIYFAAAHGVSKSKLAVGSVLEAVIQIAVLLSTSITLLLLDPRLDVLSPLVKLAMLVVLIAAIIGLMPPVFNWFMRIIFRLLRRPTLSRENRAGWRTIATAAGQYVIGAGLSGLTLFFVVKSVYPVLPFEDIFFVISVGNLAGAASMLAIFAPGGIGVRETIQLLLLGLVIPTAMAVVAVVLTRLWGVAMDALFFFVTRAAVSVSRRGSDPDPATPATPAGPGD